MFHKKFLKYPKSFVLNSDVADDFPSNILFSFVFQELKNEFEDLSPDHLISLSLQFINALLEMLTQDQKPHLYFQTGSLREEEYTKIFNNIALSILKKASLNNWVLSPQKRNTLIDQLQSRLEILLEHNTVYVLGITAFRPRMEKLLMHFQNHENINLVLSWNPVDHPIYKGDPLYLSHKLIGKLEKTTVPLFLKNSSKKTKFAFSNQTDEVIAITDLTQHFLNEGKQVMIVVENSSLRRLILKRLDTLKILPLKNRALFETPKGQFLFQSAFILANPLEIQSLIDYMKHPFLKLDFEEICRMEVEVRQKNFSFILDSEPRKISHPIFQDFFEKMSDLKRKPFLEGLQELILSTDENYNDLFATLTLFPKLDSLGMVSLIKTLLQSTYIESENTQRKASNVSVLSPLEARLQISDVMILAGLNKTLWPSSKDNLWLGDEMRNNNNLPSFLEYSGLSKLDFEQLSSSSPLTFATYSEKIEGTLEKPSTLLLFWNKGELPFKERILAPTPLTTRPFAKVPGQNFDISVTDLKLLLKNPYCFYMKHFLKLIPLKKIPKTLGPQEIGTIIHRVIEKIMKAQNTPDIDQILSLLPLNIYQKFQLKSLCELIVGKKEQLSQEGFEFVAEEKVTFSIGNFTIRARCDLLLKRNGQIERIIDYKSSTPPSIKSVERGDEFPMVIESLALKTASRLEYWHTPLHASQIKTSHLEIDESWIDTMQDALEEKLKPYMEPEIIFENSKEEVFEKEYNLLLKRASN